MTKIKLNLKNKPQNKGNSVIIESRCIEYVSSNGDVDTVPRQAKEGDACFDLVATSDPIIVGRVENGRWASIDYIEYKTDLAIDPGQNMYSIVFPRSSVSNYNLILANSCGVIDNGYRGEIKLRFKYIYQPEDLERSCGLFDFFSYLFSFNLGIKVNLDKIYKKGDKIGQIAFFDGQNVTWKQVSKFSTSTNRGSGGFGSSGK